MTGEFANALRCCHRGRHILLVDDEPVNLEIARYLLEDSGLVVDTAEDGLQACLLYTSRCV